jgi:hypothetical protein
MIQNEKKDLNPNPHKVAYNALKSYMESLPSDTPEYRIDMYKSDLEMIDKRYQDSLKEKATDNE